MSEAIFFPTAAEILEIQREVTPRLTANRPIFTEMPMVDVDSDELVWEIRDNIRGLQRPRGIDGQPQSIKSLGANQYSFKPGYYGEFAVITEFEMLKRRKVGTFGSRIDLTDLVMERQEQLLVRRLDRIEWIAWQLVRTGKFYVPADTGYVHKDAFEIETYASDTPWTNQSSSTPLADLREIRLKQRGTGSSFGAGSKIYVNQKTMDALLANTNATDLGGKRTGGLANVLSPNDLNTVLVGEGLPTFVVYDEGYFDETGVWVTWIADGEGVLFGRRPAGQTLGEYRMTVNILNDGRPGAYTGLVDKRAEKKPFVEVHDGHNGGPIIYYPSAVVTCSFF